MNKTIRIGLVDGCELIRHGLRGMLEPEQDMQVVGSYASAEEALIEMAKSHYDILLMGTRLSGIGCIEATRSFKKSEVSQNADIIILAESPDLRTDALKAGAASYLLKDVSQAELAQTIRQVYQNKRSIEECDDLAEEAIELVIPPHCDAGYLFRFMHRLGVTFSGDYASIIYTAGSWDRGSIVTIRAKPAISYSFLFQLANMPEVEKVEEVPVASSTFSSFTEKFGLKQRLGLNPGKRFQITLKEITAARPELAATGN
ncbi:response regulator transcription factor [Chloroflexota bacterium]